MFDFFNDLFSEIDKKSYRYQVDSGKKIVIEGFKNILLITDSRIVLKLFDGELEISGQNFKVKQLGQNNLVVKGDIFSVKTERVSNGK